MLLSDAGGRRWFPQISGAEKVDWSIFGNVRGLRQQSGYRDKYMIRVVPAGEASTELWKLLHVLQVFEQEWTRELSSATARIWRVA